MIGVSDLLPSIAASTVIATFIGGIVWALVRSGPEAGKITVEAATGLIIVQRDEIKDLRDRIDFLEARQLENAPLRQRVVFLEEENQQLRTQNASQGQEIQVLREDIAILRDATIGDGDPPLPSISPEGG